MDRPFSPVLQPLKSEFRSLALLPRDVEGLIEPRIWVRQEFKDRRRFKRKIVRSANDFIGELPVIGRKSLPFIFDFQDNLIRSIEDIEFFSDICNELSSCGLDVTPAISVRMVELSEYEFLQALNDLYGRVALRIDFSEFRRRDASYKSFILEKVRVNLKNIDIILEIGQISEGHLSWVPDEAAALLGLVLDRLPSSGVTICGSSFPRTLGDVPEMGMRRFRRYEFDLWREIDRLVGGNTRLSDHGPMCRSFSPGWVPPKYHRGNIRYTMLEHYYCWRGIPNVWKNLQQYKILASKVRDFDHFRGASYSEAEKMIENESRSVGLSQGPPYWTTVGHVQHIVFTARSLRAEPGRLGLSTPFG